MFTEKSGAEGVQVLQQGVGGVPLRQQVLLQACRQGWQVGDPHIGHILNRVRTNRLKQHRTIANFWSYVFAQIFCPLKFRSLRSLGVCAVVDLDAITFLQNKLLQNRFSLFISDAGSFSGSFLSKKGVRICIKRVGTDPKPWLYALHISLFCSVIEVRYLKMLKLWSSFSCSAGGHKSLWD